MGILQDKKVWVFEDSVTIGQHMEAFLKQETASAIVFQDPYKLSDALTNNSSAELPDLIITDKIFSPTSGRREAFAKEEAPSDAPAIIAQAIRASGKSIPMIIYAGSETYGYKKIPGINMRFFHKLGGSFKDVMQAAAEMLNPQKGSEIA